MEWRLPDLDFEYCMTRYMVGVDDQATKIHAKLLLQSLRSPNIGVIVQSGYEGMGRWRITKYAVEMARESHLFDHVIWLELSEGDQRPQNLQKRIANCLGIEFSAVEDSEDYVNTDIAKAIHEKLKHKRFLLVLGDVYEFIDLTGVGVPYVLKDGWMKKRVAVGSKVVFITTLEYERINIPHDKKFSFTLTKSSLPVAYRMVHEEVAEVAHSLNKKMDGSHFTIDNVIGFLMYLYVNGKIDNGDHWKHKRLLRYSMAEGFVTNNTTLIGGFGKRGGGEIKHKTTEEEMILAERVIKPLLKELYYHSFILDANHKTTPSGQFMRFVERNKRGQDGELRAIAITSKNTSGVTSLPNPAVQWHNLTALFIILPQANELDIPPTFFDNMQSLCVLELHFLPMTSLPSSLSYLSNLRLLCLQNCCKLTALPTSLQCLKRLEFLDLSGCIELQTIPQEIFEQMSSLRHLDLSNSNIKSLPSSVCNLSGLQILLLASCESLIKIPEKSFESMQQLEVLDLSGCLSLESLPSLLANLVRLKQLYLTSCSSLNRGLGVGAHLLKSFSSLEVLDLNYCCDLADFQLQDVFFRDLVPNIRYIDLSGLTTPKQLSFRGCENLEHLELVNNKNLEVLDLSGTIQLKYLRMRYEGFECKYSLRRLVMLPINYRDSQDVLFQELNWHDNDVGARLWVTDPNIFKNVSHEVFQAKCFSRFYIRVSSSSEEKPKMPMPLASVQSIHVQGIYKQIRSYFQTHSFPYFNSTCDLHLEIYRCKASLKPLHYILHQAKLLTFFDHSFVEFLTETEHNLERLVECRIGSCQNMKAIFCGIDDRYSIFENLKVMWISDLPQLTTVYKGPYHPDSFALLKHVHIEGCPKLTTAFTGGFHLNNLETLEIKFCSRLKDVFGDKVPTKENSLQGLESLCLWELPKLENICKGYLPKLQKMRVRGCRKLTKLPLRVPTVGNRVSHSACTEPVVEIEGELNWWKKLQWVDEVDAIKRPAHFRPGRLSRFAVRH